MSPSVGGGIRQFSVSSELSSFSDGANLLFPIFDRATVLPLVQRREPCRKSCHGKCRRTSSGGANTTLSGIRRKMLTQTRGRDVQQDACEAYGDAKKYSGGHRRGDPQKHTSLNHRDSTRETRRYFKDNVTRRLHRSGNRSRGRHNSSVKEQVSTRDHRYVFHSRFPHTKNVRDTHRQGRTNRRRGNSPIGKVVHLTFKGTTNGSARGHAGGHHGFRECRTYHRNSGCARRSRATSSFLYFEYFVNFSFLFRFVRVGVVNIYLERRITTSRCRMRGAYRNGQRASPNVFGRARLGVPRAHHFRNSINSSIQENASRYTNATRTYHGNGKRRFAKGKGIHFFASASGRQGGAHHNTYVKRRNERSDDGGRGTSRRFGFPHAGGLSSLPTSVLNGANMGRNNTCSGRATRRSSHQVNGSRGCLFGQRGTRGPTGGNYRG